MILLLLMGGIYFYKTYALYEEKKEFNVLKGIVPDFSNIITNYIVNGESATTIPSKKSGYEVTNVVCDKGSIATWDSTNWKLNITKLTDKNITCTIVFERNFSNYIANLSETNSSILKHSFEQTEQTPVLTDYRYIGKEPNNYVCFEEGEGVCQNDNNLYRIIGLIPTQKEENGEYENRIKLIKSSSYGEADMGPQSYLDWVDTDLNKNKLNIQFWESLGTYQNAIEKAKWYNGSTISSASGSANDLYKSERSNSAIFSDWKLYNIANVSLMYLSDFGFSTGESTRTQCINGNVSSWDTTCQGNSWLNQNYENQWVLDHMKNTFYKFYITSSQWKQSYRMHSYSYRPTFYLKAKVGLKSGMGTKEEPYRININ